MFCLLSLPLSLEQCLINHMHSIFMSRRTWWLDGYVGNTKLKWLCSSCLTWIKAEVNNPIQASFSVIISGAYKSRLVNISLISPLPSRKGLPFLG